MSRPLQNTFDIVAHAAWMFAAWATARIALWMYVERDSTVSEALLKVATDVEIHSLRFLWGWDLVVFVLFAAVVATVQKLRRRSLVVPTIVSTLLATAFSIGMVMYPALVLSGRMSSPFVGVGRSFKESVAFAVVVMLALLSLIALLARVRRENPPTHPPAQS